MKNRRSRQKRARIYATAAIESSTWVGLVEVVNDSRYLDTLVLIQLVFE